MNKNIISIFFLLLFVSVSLNAQTPAIRFDDAKHDFGTIYKGQAAEHEFVFTNTSDKPVALQSVKAACGCTTPKWSADPIQPQGKGSVAAKYDTYRIGQFTKTITVTYDTAAAPIMLTISGNVLDTTPEGNRNNPHMHHEHDGHNHGPSTLYNFPQGAISFEKLSEEVGVIDTDKTRELNFKIRNMGRENMEFYPNTVQQDPVFTNLRFVPPVLQAGQEGVISLTFDASKYDQTGNFTKILTIATNDPLGLNKSLTVTGTFNKVLSAEEKAMAPVIRFEQTEYTAKKVISGEKVVYAFKFTNAGKSDLVIESAKASCGCTVADLREKVIKPGASSEIIATFDSNGRSGQNNKTITVKSNDPLNENVVLKLNVNVEADPFHAGDSGPVEKKN